MLQNQICAGNVLELWSEVWRWERDPPNERVRVGTRRAVLPRDFLLRSCLSCPTREGEVSTPSL